MTTPEIARTIAEEWLDITHGHVQVVDELSLVQTIAKHIAPLVEDRDRRATVVCLCGSCRFQDAWVENYAKESDAGKIVLTISRLIPKPEQDLSPEHKVRLDDLHKRKIDLADEILVLNVGGYIGESTRNEIAYATSRGKPVRYLEAQP